MVGYEPRETQMAYWLNRTARLCEYNWILPTTFSMRMENLSTIAALIERATNLLTALHDLMYQASGLVKALKQHRRRARPPTRRADDRLRRERP